MGTLENLINGLVEARPDEYALWPRSSIPRTGCRFEWRPKGNLAYIYQKDLNNSRYSYIEITEHTIRVGMTNIIHTLEQMLKIAKKQFEDAKMSGIMYIGEYDGTISYRAMMNDSHRIRLTSFGPATELFIWEE